MFTIIIYYYMLYKTSYYCVITYLSKVVYIWYAIVNISTMVY